MIGIYQCAISTFMEPHHIHKASNHPGHLNINMHHFYLQHPPSHKHALMLGMLNAFAIFVGELSTQLLLSLAFKLAWKTATLLGLVTAKLCYDLTILYIDNQHLFLQHHAAIFHFHVWWQDG